jgi:hypothetical protein
MPKVKQPKEATLLPPNPMPTEDQMMEAMGEPEESKMKRHVQKIDDPRAAQNVAETFISQAIQKGVPVETLERLLAMRQQLKAEFAKEAFNRALAEFQAECPVIEKTKKVDFTSKRTGNRTNYAYAPLEVIVQQVKEFLQRHGFSYTITAEVDNNSMMTAICTVTHELGHSEQSKFQVPIDKDSYMNAQQQFASALTFAKRYAFCNAFGILTGDEDDDATHLNTPAKSPPTTAPKAPKPQAPKAPTPEQQKQKIVALAISLGFYENVEAVKAAGEGFREKIKVNTDLEPTPENYAEIISRLQVMKIERS